MTEAKDVLETAADVARRAARRLADELDPALPGSVERELAGTPGQYVDPISLGALVVSIASLAWTIYHDRGQDQAEPSAEALRRRVRIEVGQREEACADQRDLIIEVVVDEMLDGSREG